MMERTPEQWFELGAEAMRTEISVRLMMAGNVEQSQFVLNQPIPKFQIPETFTVENSK